MNNKIKNREKKRELVREQQSRMFMDSMGSATELFAKYLQEYQINTDVSFKVRPNHGWNKHFVPFTVEFNNNAWNAIKFEHKTYHTEDQEVSIRFNVHSEYGLNVDRGYQDDSLVKLAFFGKVAEMVNNEQNRIITEMTELLMKYEEVYMTFQREIGSIDAEISDIKKEVAKKAQEKLLNKLQTTGVDTNKEDGWRYTTFDYGYKKTFYNVTNVKIVNISKSGKTANIEVTTNAAWDNSGEHSETAKKVNIDKVLAFAKLNNEK